MNADPTPTVPLLIDSRGAAKLLNIGERTLHRMVKAGELPSVKIGGLRRFRPETLRAHVAALEAEHAAGGAA